MHLRKAVLSSCLVLIVLGACALPPRAPRVAAPAAPDTGVAHAATSHDLAPGAPTVQFGMDNILPNDYTAIPGIKSKPWTVLATGAGARFNHWEFKWSDIEQAHGTYTFTKYDPIVSAAQAAGIGMVGLLEATPYWASSTVTATGTQVPANLYLPWNDPNNYWGAFVYATAQHYRGQVAVWEIWNEPDQYNNRSWGGTEADYYQLLKVAYLAVKAADPQALVSFAGLNYLAGYLADVAKLALADPTAPAHNYYFDIAAVHPYFRPRAAYLQVQAVRDALRSLGIPAKPVWATETGLPAWNDPPTARRANTGTAQEQADYIIQTFASALAAGASALFSYRASDVGEPQEWGLLKADGSQRLAFSAYARAVAYMAGTQTVSYPAPSSIVQRIVLDQGQRRVTVVWDASPVTVTTSIPASAAGGLLVDDLGHELRLDAGPTAAYSLTLPGATDNNGANSSDFIVGGRPYFIIENAPYLPTPTPPPAPTNTPIAVAPTPASSPPTDTPVPSATPTPLPTDTPTPSATPTDTPTPSATPTQTPIPTPTATPTLAVGPVRSSSYFAEGYTGAGYREEIALANPSARAAHVRLTFMTSDGSTIVHVLSIDPWQRLTLDVGSLVGPNQQVATEIDADGPVGAQRTIYHDQDASSTVGAAAPSQTWYLPEGYTGPGYREFLLLQNPNPDAAGVTVQFVPDHGEARSLTLHVDPYSRLTLNVGRYVKGQGVGTVVTADLPIVAERASYFGPAGHAGMAGHLGVSALSTRWFFAEGYTGSDYHEYLPLLNPNLYRAATVTVRLYDPSGTQVATQTLTLPPLSRRTVVVNRLVANRAISAVVEADAPIAAERSMYFGPNDAGGSDSTGVATPAVTWLLPDGNTTAASRTAGTLASPLPAPRDFHEYILLLNPAPRPVRVAVTYMDTRGVRLERRYLVSAHSRFTVDVAHDMPDSVHAALVSCLSGVPIVVEQSIYFNGGLGGDSSSGIPLDPGVVAPPAR